MAVLASDNFNRANANDLGTDWDIITSENNLTIITNQCGPASASMAGDASESNNSVTWPNDQYSKVTFVACAHTGAADSGVGIGPAVRCATAARTFYRAVAAGTTANGTELAKFVAGSYTPLAHSAQSWVATDTVECRAVGTTISVRRNGSEIISVTDSSIASGRAGISYSSQSTTALVDDWEGGDFSSTADNHQKAMVVMQAVSRAATY